MIELLNDPGINVGPWWLSIILMVACTVGFFAVLALILAAFSALGRWQTRSLPIEHKPMSHFTDAEHIEWRRLENARIYGDRD